MSLSAAIIDALLATGATREQIAAAMKADIAEREAQEAARTEAQREGNRARQQRKRLRDNGVSRDVTDVTRDARDTPPNDIYSNPPVTPLDISNEISPPTEIQSENGLKPEHVVEAWNAMATRRGLPIVRKLTPDRRKRLAQRIRQNTIDEFTEAIGAIELSPFLCGENDRTWKADFDFLLSPQKFTKLLEGTYGQ